MKVKNVKDSIVAGGNISKVNNKVIDNSAENISIKRVRTESAIISFLVGLLTSILGSWIFNCLQQA